MTEQEWLESSDPRKMLCFLQNKTNDRKIRLFACACCRSVWHLLDEPMLKRAVEVAERRADGLEDDQELQAARLEISPGPYFTGTYKADAALGAVLNYGGSFPIRCIDAAANVACGEAIRQALNQGKGHLPLETMEGIRRIQADILRCVVGSLPFDPTVVDRRWLTSTVIDMTNAIYCERAFDRMPILADALMDAGCDSEPIISHCRQSGGHALGCWVVDLLLDKK